MTPPKVALTALEVGNSTGKRDPSLFDHTKSGQRRPQRRKCALDHTKTEKDHTKSGQKEPTRKKCAVDHTKTDIRSQSGRFDLAKTTSAKLTIPDAKKGPYQIRAAVRIPRS